MYKHKNRTRKQRHIYVRSIKLVITVINTMGPNSKTQVSQLSIYQNDLYKLMTV
jgi:hypothetical protein